MGASRNYSSYLNIDQINIVMMLVSCALAYVMPFELVLISYAFLGPAHYLTQISWMHDRSYFTETKWTGVVLGILVAAMILLEWDNIKIGTHYFVLTAAIALSCAMVLEKQTKYRSIIIASLVVFFIAIESLYPSFAIGLAILLPTVVHIYIFTGLFILLGAMKVRIHGGLFHSPFLSPAARCFLSLRLSIIFCFLISLPRRLIRLITSLITSRVFFHLAER